MALVAATSPAPAKKQLDKTTVALIAALITSVVFAVLIAALTYWKKKVDNEALYKLDTERVAALSKVEQEILAAKPNPAIQPTEDKTVIVDAPTHTIVTGSGEENATVYRLSDVLQGRMAPEGLHDTYLGSVVTANGQAGSQQSAAERQFENMLIAEAMDGVPQDEFSTRLAEREALNVLSRKYCGGDGWIYISSGKPNSRGQCFKQCEDDEDYLIWKAPAGDLSGTPHRVCRKRCPGKQDQRGFCERKFFNPTWLLGYMPIALNNLEEEPAKERSPYDITNPFLPPQRSQVMTGDQLYCNTLNVESGYRHYGKDCIWIGSEKNRGDYRKGKMNCGVHNYNAGYKNTTNGLHCYKCPVGTELKGTEVSGYVCASPCPTGSTEARTGSTYACYLIARSLRGENLSRTANYTDAEVAEMERLAALQNKPAPR
jgi:hypothetical protein